MTIANIVIKIVLALWPFFKENLLGKRGFIEYFSKHKLKTSWLAAKCVLIIYTLWVTVRLVSVSSDHYELIQTCNRQGLSESAYKMSRLYPEPLKGTPPAKPPEVVAVYTVPEPTKTPIKQKHRQPAVIKPKAYASDLYRDIK